MKLFDTKEKAFKEGLNVEIVRKFPYAKELLKYQIIKRKKDNKYYIRYKIIPDKKYKIW